MDVQLLYYKRYDAHDVPTSWLLLYVQWHGHDIGLLRGLGFKASGLRAFKDFRLAAWGPVDPGSPHYVSEDRLFWSVSVSLWAPGEKLP